MLFNLLLAGITILLCFFVLLLVFLTAFLTIPVEIENAGVKLALTIPTGAIITTANGAISMKNMTYQNVQKK